MASKKIGKVSLAELVKRVPPNQEKEFLTFRKLNHDYLERMNKYPEKLPTIDWEYYRKNVRSEYVKMVDEFEQKYKELNTFFDSRHEMDLSKYFTQIDDIRSNIQNDLAEYKAESDERIKELEMQIEALKKLPLYEQMTIEEFCDLRPDKIKECGIPAYGTTSYWPHTEEEQPTGPDDKSHHDDHDEAKATADKKLVDVKDKAKIDASQKKDGKSMSTKNVKADMSVKKEEKTDKKSVKVDKKTADGKEKTTGKDKDKKK